MIEMIRFFLAIISYNHIFDYVSVIRPGTQAAEGLTKLDLDKRMKVGKLVDIRFYYIQSSEI